MINYINIVCDYIVTIVFYILDTSIICIAVLVSHRHTYTRFIQPYLDSF